MTNPLTEINQLTEELAEAIAVATFESLETAIDAWHEGELLAGRAVPDFWDDCRTSEMLAQHLTALGWVRGPSVQALVDASGHTPEDAAHAALVEIRDRASLDIQEIAERVVGKRIDCECELNLDGLLECGCQYRLTRWTDPKETNNV